MKTYQGNFAVRALALAVQGALAAMCVVPLQAIADDQASEDVQALISPTNTAEFGVVTTSQKSAKFGEYNGLDKQGADVVGNFGLRGGDAYGRGSGTTRWSINGAVTGADSHEFGATLSNQGKWSVGFDSDLLTHNITDSFRTPYQGSAGANSFTTPYSFGTVATNGTLTAAQKAAPTQQAVASKRDTKSFNVGVNLDREWGLTFDYKHIDQSGAKLISGPTDKDVLNNVVWRGEGVAMLMNPTESKTDNFTVALNWTGESAFFSGSYYGSLYRDDYNAFSFANLFLSGPIYTGGVAGSSVPTGTGYPMDTMSTPPSNQFHQLNLSGGYHFSPATRLVGEFSYGRNTQDDSFAGTYTNTSQSGSTFSSAATSPTSLDGKVITKHLDLGLTHRATKDLNLNAGLKYNERDNQTSSHQYSFLVLGDSVGVASAATGGASSPPTPIPVTNVPISWKHTQFELAGDYRIDSRQHVRAAYAYDDMKRRCNNDDANVAAGYYTQTTCVQVKENKENRVSVDYKISVSDALRLKAGYAYGNRNADVTDVRGTNAGVASATGQYNIGFYNPIVDNGAYEYTGFVAFFQASRKENQFKLGASWQPLDQLSVDFSGKYSKDDYDSNFGVAKGTEYSTNLDATYAFSDTNSVNAYVSTQKRERDLSDAYAATAAVTINGVAVTPTPSAANPLLLAWSNTLTDKQVAIGIGAKQKSLMGGKLDLSEDLSYSLAKTDYSTSFPWAATGNRNCTGIVASTAFCGALPTIKSDLISLKLMGGYKLDKTSRVLLGYQYQHLKAEDVMYYQYYQPGYKTGVVPDYQQAPSYSEGVVFAAYQYSFK